MAAALAVSIAAAGLAWADGAEELAPAPPIAVRPAGETVRVLLFETPDRVRVRLAPSEPWIEISAAEGGVRVGDSPPAAFWRSRGRDTIEVDRLELRGAVEVRPSPRGLAVVNELELESYLAGSLGREMYASWSPAALRAQAVASRTYALHRIQRARRSRSRGFDLTADTSSQVYGGVAAESVAVRAAVEATRGQILTFGGRPILAAFHSASGGVTASSDEVWGEPHEYLISQRVEGEDDSPDTYWRAAITRTTLRRAVAGLGSPIGEIRKLEVVARAGSGRALRLRATGARGTAEFTGRDLRRALGESALRSTLFEVRRSEDEFVFVGSGRGHGVGMSQWGARALAERGQTYQEILRVFYPGTELQHRELQGRGLPGTQRQAAEMRRVTPLQRPGNSAATAGVRLAPSALALSENRAR